MLFFKIAKIPLKHTVYRQLPGGPPAQPENETGKKSKKSVVRPERNIIVEDLYFGSLGVGRPHFRPVMVFIGAVQ
jgi:hypothetical protein